MAVFLRYMAVDREVAGLRKPAPAAGQDARSATPKQAAPEARPAVAPAASTANQPPEPAPAIAIPGARRIGVAVTDFSMSANIPESEVVQAIIRDGLINNLTMQDGLRVVERAKLSEGLAELRMGAEGTLDPATALKLGKIVGARVIILGNIVKLDDKLTVTARLMNAETSELAAVRVEGSRSELMALVDQLAQAIAYRIATDNGGVLTRKTSDSELADIRAKQQAVRSAIAGKKLPRVLVMVPETHLGQRIPDPAGETELILWFTDCGFPLACAEYSGVHVPSPAGETTMDTDVNVVRNRGLRNEARDTTIASRAVSRIIQGDLSDEREKLAQIADVLIIGEGISERGTEREGLISSKGRLEVKAIDVKSGAVLLADSAYGAGVDVAERIAGKRALQVAGRDLAAKLIPALVEKWNAAPAQQ
jgi:TolB-like protein